MSRWWHYAVEGLALAFFAVTAAAAAPVVVASEAGFFLAEAGMTVGEAQGILATSMAGAGLAAGAIVSTAVIDANSKSRGRNLTDPFDSPIKKQPRPDEDDDMIDHDSDMDEYEDMDDLTGPVLDTPVPVRPRGPGFKPAHPLVSPNRGDYAGIQKTMYNPVSGSIIGLKMHARGRRGVFGGNFHTVKKIVARGSAVPVKSTHHSPVSVFGFPSS